MPEHWRYPFLPSASKILAGIDLGSLLEDYYYAEARALALTRLESSVTSGVIDVEGPPINDILFILGRKNAFLRLNNYINSDK